MLWQRDKVYVVLNFLTNTYSGVLFDEPIREFYERRGCLILAAYTGSLRNIRFAA